MAAKPKMNTEHITALQRRREELDERLREALVRVGDLRGEIRGIEHALAVVQGLGVASAPAAVATHVSADRRPRGAVKEVVLGLIVEHSADGLKTTDVVDLAKAKGTELDRNSVASLLSRLAKEGVLIYDEGSRRYKCAPPNVTPLRSVM